MTQPIIYASRNFKDEFLDQIKTIAPDYRFQTELAPEDIANVEITIGWDKKLAPELLANNRLKWVQAISAGVDYLPLKDYQKNNILLSNSSGIHATAITEHIIGVLLAYYRDLLTIAQHQENTLWQHRNELTVGQLAEKKMLIVGTGHIGQKTAQASGALGVQVYGVNTTGHQVDGFFETYTFKNLNKVAQGMDIIVNILPLTAETTAIYDSTFFSGLHPDSIFINVGRGPSVVEDDLAKALETGELAFAALDVFKTEPLPADSILWQTKNLLITPHMSGELVGFQKKFMKIFLANLKSYVADGKLVKNEVSLDKGY